MSVALMYHALYRDEDTSRISAEDLPYAVSESNFVKHLEQLSAFTVGTLSEENNSNVADIILTFDDGHVSNYDIALPHLQARGLNAYFFITTDYTDHRAHFCTAAQIKALAEAGMVIGGHGCSHAFFDDLGLDAAKRELEHSAQTLKGITQKRAESMSFPGGRYNTNTLELARSAGFSQLFGSGFGTIEPGGTGALNRIAIRRSTSAEDFDRIVHHDQRFYWQEQVKQKAKGLLKKCLGNRLYHGLYKSLSSHH